MFHLDHDRVEQVVGIAFDILDQLYPDFFRAAADLVILVGIGPVFLLNIDFALRSDAAGYPPQVGFDLGVRLYGQSRLAYLELDILGERLQPLSELLVDRVA